ncbi:MAG: glycosyltransferase family 2 protein [Nitrospirota bacterium]|nr:glycosyltransferase family 2 protein [Nitrospirota bacterium]
MIDNDECLLTIGIPTYNGEKYIQQAIESSIARIRESSRNDVEILVLDNASIDSTYELVNTYIKQYPQYISLYHNEINIGFDSNVNELFYKARGRYVQILGDDDFLEAGHLDKLIPYLNMKDPPSAVLLGVSFLNISTGERQHTNWGINNFSALSGDRFFKLSGWRSAAISSVVIETSRWRKANLERYFGTQWIHIGALIQILAKDSYACVLSYNTVVVRVGNTRWISNFGNQLKAGLEHLAVLEEMKRFGYGDVVFKYFLNDRFNNNLFDIINTCPREFSKRIEVYRLMKHFFWNRPQFWLIHVPAMLAIDAIRPIALNASKIRKKHKNIK